MNFFLNPFFLLRILLIILEIGLNEARQDGDILNNASFPFSEFLLHAI